MSETLCIVYSDYVYVRVKNTKSYSRIPTDVYNIDVNTLLSSDAHVQSTFSSSSFCLRQMYTNTVTCFIVLCVAGVY